MSFLIQCPICKATPPDTVMPWRRWRWLKDHVDSHDDNRPWPDAAIGESERANRYHAKNNKEIADEMGDDISAIPSDEEEATQELDGE